MNSLNEFNNSLEGESSKKTHTKDTPKISRNCVESVLENTTRTMQHVKVKNKNKKTTNLRQNHP